MSPEIVEPEPLRPLVSPLLAALPGVRHGFFTRQGGVSEGIYAGLNTGRGSNDDPARVEENRRRCAAHFGQAEAMLHVAYQIHSATALTVDAPWGERERPQGDGVVTARAGVICGALSADCAPILLVDPQARVVAAAHAGWKGALGGVLASTVEAMRAKGAEPARIVAAVGPCIAPASYEVGADLRDAFLGQAPDAVRFFSDRPGADRAQAKWSFDLPGFVRDRLARAGVGQAEWIGHDTYADEALFYSNRRAFHRREPDYGRLLSAVALED